MKKNLIKLSILSLALCMTSCGTSTTSLLTGGATTKTESATSTGAQLGSTLLSSVLGGIINATTTFTKDDLVGTWNYKGADCKFESENLLSQAGGEIAAATVEKKANDLFAKIGVKQNVFGMTFNADGSYTINYGSTQIPGTYTFDEKECKLTLVGLLGLGQSEVSLTYSGKNNISILFDADKVLSILTSLGSKINNSTVSTISSLLGSYDGMKIGFEMTK